MQSQLMSIYIKTERYNEAEDIAKKHPDNIIIKSKLMDVYIKKKEYDEAIKLGENDKSEVIQSNLISVYCKKNTIR